MIMCAIYYGSTVYIETNVQDLKDAFIENGYRGMLAHKWNQEKEVMDSIAGQATDNATKQDIFKQIQKYIKFHVGRERHAKLLEQIRDITSLQEMTKFDLFTAAGYAIVGFNQYKHRIQQIDKPEDNGSGEVFFQTFTYKEN